MRFQWARRLGFLDSELVFRTDAQLATSPLLAIEQFSIGGYASVRGFRESQVVRDMGVVGSLELRVPVLRASDGRPILQVAPFLDYGRGWNKEATTLAPTRDLGSAGVGVRWRASRRLIADAYWAAWRSEEVTGDSLQDHGLQFLVSFDLY
jgi:hemolysin activation/secretion protein